MTYDELLSTVKSYTIREDAPITGFMRRAETYLRIVVRHYLAEKTVVLSVIDGVVELPADFIELRIITGSTWKRYRPVNPVASILLEGDVGYYRTGNTIVFVGEHDAEISMIYASAFEDLTEENSNWLFEKFPNVYLSAILKEFHRWQTSQEGVAIEDAALKEALSIVAEDDRRGRVTPISTSAITWL